MVGKASRFESRSYGGGQVWQAFLVGRRFKKKREECIIMGSRGIIPRRKGGCSQAVMHPLTCGEKL